MAGASEQGGEREEGRGGRGSGAGCVGHWGLHRGLSLNFRTFLESFKHRVLGPDASISLEIF